MPLTPQDELHLARALALAREAVGLASPNPTVGCVIARGGTILGEGAHLYDHRDHAEIAALKQAASNRLNVQGSTAYVTLEPCSHHGRTGPCADALAAAGIGRCVVATVDPNPLVSGKGIAILRSANIEVVLAEGLLADEARRLNDAFAHFIQHRRPFVTLKAALSVDGKLAPPPATRTETAPHWITGTAARSDAQTLRHVNDAILTGIGTVLADNPSLTDRTGLPRRRRLLRVILDSELRTPIYAAVLGNANAASPNSVISTEVRAFADAAERSAFKSRDDILILCSDTASADLEAALRDLNIEVLRLPSHNEHLNLNAALAALAERNILSVLVEAGSAVNGSFLRGDLVDKLVLYFAERELGLDAIPFAEDFASPYVLQQQLTHTTRATFANGDAEDVRITGYLHDPWTLK